MNADQSWTRCEVVAESAIQSDLDVFAVRAVSPAMNAKSGSLLYAAWE